MNGQAELVRVVVLACSQAWAAAQQKGNRRQGSPSLKVFLESHPDLGDQIRADAGFVEYVHDRGDADVHVLVTSSSAGASRRDYTVALTGLGRFAGLQIVTRVGVGDDGESKTGEVDHGKPHATAPDRHFAIREPGEIIDRQY